MKNCLKTVAGFMALTAVSMSLQAAVSANISSANSADQSHSAAIEMLSPSTSETFLEQVRIRHF